MLADLSGGNNHVVKQEAEQLDEAAETIEDYITRDFIRTAVARVSAALGDAPSARRQLRSVITSANRLGLFLDALNAKRALGETDRTTHFAPGK
jgi:hypothetical protein